MFEFQNNHGLSEDTDPRLIAYLDKLKRAYCEAKTHILLRPIMIKDGLGELLPSPKDDDMAGIYLLIQAEDILKGQEQ